MYRQKDQLVTNRMIPLDWLNFRHHIPIVVAKRSNPGGSYLWRTKTIVMNSSTLTPNFGPVLFHEFMHAIQANTTLIRPQQQLMILLFWLNHRFANPERFAKRSHMLANDQEFFATSLTAFLVAIHQNRSPSQERDSFNWLPIGLNTFKPNGFTLNLIEPIGKTLTRIMRRSSVAPKVRHSPDDYSARFE